MNYKTTLLLASLSISACIKETPECDKWYVTDAKANLACSKMQGCIITAKDWGFVYRVVKASPQCFDESGDL